LANARRGGGKKRITAGSIESETIGGDDKRRVGKGNGNEGFLEWFETGHDSTCRELGKHSGETNAKKRKERTAFN